MERFFWDGRRFCFKLYFLNNVSEPHRFSQPRGCFYGSFQSSSQAIVSLPSGPYVDIILAYKLRPHSLVQWALSMSNFLPPLRQLFPHLTTVSVDNLRLYPELPLSLWSSYVHCSSINSPKPSDQLYRCSVPCPYLVVTVSDS